MGQIPHDSATCCQLCLDLEPILVVIAAENSVEVGDTIGLCLERVAPSVVPGIYLGVLGFVGPWSRYLNLTLYTSINVRKANSISFV